MRKAIFRLALLGINLGLERLKAKEVKTENISTKRKNELAMELTSLIQNHKNIWVLRNREGGLSDSASKLENLLNYLKK